MLSTEKEVATRSRRRRAVSAVTSGWSRVRAIVRGQSVNIVSRDEAASQSSIDFRNSADVCGDEGQSGRGSLQNDIGQGLRPRRYHHDAPKCLRLTRRHSRLELDDINQTETLNLSSQRVTFGAVADQGCGYDPAGAMQMREGVDQDIDAFDRPELTHEHQIAGVSSRFYRLEFFAGYAVVYDPHKPARRADFAAKYVRAVCAFKQKQVSAQHQHFFCREIEFSGQSVVAEQQTAAMWGIGAYRASGIEGQASIRAPFGAVTVHDVGTGLRDPAHDLRKRESIAWSDVAAHGDAANAEGK